MGSWDVSPFGNDEAREWLANLIANPSTEPVFRALVTAAKIKNDEFFQAPECERAVAAAEIVACVRDKATADTPPGLKKWLAENKLVVGDQVAQMAIRVLERIAKDSELKQVYDDTDSAEDWYRTLHNIQQRLRESYDPQVEHGLPDVPESESRLCERGAALVAVQKYDEALALYETAADAYPRSQIVFMGKGICHLWLKNYEKVIEDINQALSLDKPIADAYQLRSQAFFHLGKYQHVVADLTSYLRARPQHMESYYIRGLAYEQLKKYESAIKDFTFIIERSTGDHVADALNHRANCYDVFERPDLAAYDRRMAAQLIAIESSRRV